MNETAVPAAPTVAEIAPGLLLRSLSGRSLRQAPADFAPATWLIQEWGQYSLEAVGGERTPHLVAGTLPNLRVAAGALLFQFENQLGLATFEIELANHRYKICLEVLSAKFPEPASHRTFFGRLVDDLQRWAPAIEFSVESATTFRTVESLRPPSDIFVWHFLRKHGSAIEEATETIVRQPRRELVQYERERRIGELQSISSRMLDAFVEVLANYRKSPSISQPQSGQSAWRSRR